MKQQPRREVSLEPEQRRGRADWTADTVWTVTKTQDWKQRCSSTVWRFPPTYIQKSNTFLKYWWRHGTRTHIRRALHAGPLVWARGRNRLSVWSSASGSPAAHLSRADAVDACAFRDLHVLSPAVVRAELCRKPTGSWGRLQNTKETQGKTLASENDQN